MSLRLRLALFGAGVVALALVVFGVLLYTLLARGAATNQDDALRTRAAQAVTAINASGAPAASSPVAPINLETSTDFFIEVFDPNGSLLYSTATPAVAPDLQVGNGGRFVTQQGFRMYVTPFDQGYVVTGQSSKVPQASLSGVVVFLIISGSIALLAATLASWLVAGRALRPLNAVASMAEDIGQTRDFGRRLPSQRSRDEVARLATSFNGMLSRLQDSFEAQRRFVADASHELRTPLTTIQGNAGLLAAKPVSQEIYRAAASDLVRESARMARLIDRLLTLAQADSGLLLRLARIDLAPVVEEVCRQAAVAHPGQKLDVVTVPALVDGDDDALRQLLWILLDNAFRYASSAVEVSLRTEPGWARLVVADDGPGIPSAYRERIFERFYRVEGSRSGQHSGLGLSIASWITEQHHGRIVAGEALLGGAAFLVDLPLLPTS